MSSRDRSHSSGSSAKSFPLLDDTSSSLRDSASTAPYTRFPTVPQASEEELKDDHLGTHMPESSHGSTASNTSRTPSVTQNVHDPEMTNSTMTPTSEAALHPRDRTQTPDLSNEYVNSVPSAFVSIDSADASDQDLASGSSQPFNLTDETTLGIEKAITTRSSSPSLDNGLRSPASVHYQELLNGDALVSPTLLPPQAKVDPPSPSWRSASPTYLSPSPKTRDAPKSNKLKRKSSKRMTGDIQRSESPVRHFSGTVSTFRETPRDDGIEPKTQTLVSSRSTPQLASAAKQNINHRRSSSQSERMREHESLFGKYLKNVPKVPESSSQPMSKEEGSTMSQNSSAPSPEHALLESTSKEASQPLLEETDKPSGSSNVLQLQIKVMNQHVTEGCPVRGLVHVVAEQDAWITDPVVEIVGAEHASWTPEPAVFFYASYTVDFSSVTQISGSTPSKKAYRRTPSGEVHLLSKGEHIVPFHVSIPADGTSKGMWKGAEGDVGYTATCRIEHSSGMLNKVRSPLFAIVPALPPSTLLGEMPSWLTTAVTKTTGSIDLTAKLHKSSWVAGHDCHVTLDIDNRSSSTALEKVSVSLVRLLKTRSQMLSAWKTVRTEVSRSTYSRAWSEQPWLGVSPGMLLSTLTSVRIPSEELSVSRGQFFEVNYIIDITLDGSDGPSAQIPLKVVSYASLDIEADYCASKNESRASLSFDELLPHDLPRHSKDLVHQSSKRELTPSPFLDNVSFAPSPSFGSNATTAVEKSQNDSDIANLLLKGRSALEPSFSIDKSQVVQKFEPMDVSTDRGSSSPLSFSSPQLFGSPADEEKRAQSALSRHDSAREGSKPRHHGISDTEGDSRHKQFLNKLSLECEGEELNWGRSEPQHSVKESYSAPGRTLKVVNKASMDTLGSVHTGVAPRRPSHTKSPSEPNLLNSVGNASFGTAPMNSSDPIDVDDLQLPLRPASTVPTSRPSLLSDVTGSRKVPFDNHPLKNASKSEKAKESSSSAAGPKRSKSLSFVRELFSSNKSKKAKSSQAEADSFSKNRKGSATGPEQQQRPPPIKMKGKLDHGKKSQQQVHQERKLLRRPPKEFPMEIAVPMENRARSQTHTSMPITRPKNSFPREITSMNAGMERRTSMPMPEGPQNRARTPDADVIVRPHSSQAHITERPRPQPSRQGKPPVAPSRVPPPKLSPEKLATHSRADTQGLGLVQQTSVNPISGDNTEELPMSSSDAHVPSNAGRLPKSPSKKIAKSQSSQSVSSNAALPTEVFGEALTKDDNSITPDNAALYQEALSLPEVQPFSFGSFRLSGTASVFSRAQSMATSTGASSLAPTRRRRHSSAGDHSRRSFSRSTLNSGITRSLSTQSLSSVAVNKSYNETADLSFLSGGEPSQGYEQLNASSYDGYPPLELSARPFTAEEYDERASGEILENDDPYSNPIRQQSEMAFLEGYPYPYPDPYEQQYADMDEPLQSQAFTGYNEKGKINDMNFLPYNRRESSYMDYGFYQKRDSVNSVPYMSQTSLGQQYQRALSPEDRMRQIMSDLEEGGGYQMNAPDANEAAVSEHVRMSSPDSGTSSGATSAASIIEPETSQYQHSLRTTKGIGPRKLQRARRPVTPDSNLRGSWVGRIGVTGPTKERDWEAELSILAAAADIPGASAIIDDSLDHYW